MPQSLYAPSNKDKQFKACNHFSPSSKDHIWVDYHAEQLNPSSVQANISSGQPPPKRYGQQTVKSYKAKYKPQVQFNAHTISSWDKIILCVIMRRAFVSDSASRSCSAAVAVSSFKLWFEKWGKAWHLKVTNENKHQLGRISISHLKFCTKGCDFCISTICRLFCSFKSSLWQETFQYCNKNC